MSSIRLRKPKADANKYSRGKLVVIAGSRKYPGAAALAGAAGYAASRCGAGYVQVITDAAAVAAVQAYRPSLVVTSWEPDGHILQELPVDVAEKPCAYVLGPGFDAQDELMPSLVAEALEIEAPLVIDGGALGFISQEPLLSKLRQRASACLTTVITPHGGEAQRLAKGIGLVETESDQLALKLAQRLGVIALVKGPVSYISDARNLVMMDEGTPALAKAGTGDVLAGMLGGILAQGIDVLEGYDAPDEPWLRQRRESAYFATILASRLHALTGRIATQRYTDISCTTEDIVEAIPDAIRETQERE